MPKNSHVDKPTASFYDQFAEYYDLWTSLVPSTREDFEFYLEQASSARGPVVELGVGTARMAVALAKEGIPVIGIDGSAQMLALAEQKLQDEGLISLVELVHGDFLAWKPPVPADLAISPYHTFGHVLAHRRGPEPFRSVFEMLRPGGRFAFNLLEPDLDAMRDRDGVPQAFGTVPVDDAEAHVTVTYVHDWDAARFNSTIEGRLMQDGVLLLEDSWSFDIGWATVAEVDAWVTSAGFTIDYVSGSLLGPAPVVPGSEQVWVLRRPAD